MVDATSEVPAESARASAGAAWLDYLVYAALALVFLKNYWVSEDAYLNFRSVDQLLSGHGPRWNPHERAQVFTSPLWFWLHALAQLIVRDGYLAVFLLSSACFGFTLRLLRQLSGSSLGFVLAGLLLIGSNTCFDYTSAGQENVLGYCLVLYYLRAYLDSVEGQPTSSQLGRLVICAGLLVVCRHDLITLIVPSLVFACWNARRAIDSRSWLTLAALASAPLLVWSLYSLIYFGSVLPNTAYAKLSSGFPRAVFLERGLDYLLVLARYDVLTLLCMLAAIVVLAAQRSLPARFIAASIATNIAYVVYVGGDYMQGRFLSHAALISIVMLARLAWSPARWVGGAIAVSLLAYAVVYPRTPLNTSLEQPKPDGAVHAPGREFVMDARGTLGLYTSLYSYLQAEDAANYPQHPLAIEGRKFARSDRTVAVIHAAGMFGWAAGTSKIIIEAHGIADPLLARLPASVFAGVGHYMRYRPEGYVDGLMQGRVQIEDPGLREYHAKLTLLTESPELFSWQRLEAIAGFSWNVYDPLLAHFVREKIAGKQKLPKDTRPR